MHDDIKAFTVEGVINADKFIQTRDRLIHNIETDMREDGYAPVLDLTPQFTREYDAEHEVFNFKLTIYGVYVGKETAWQTAGLTNGRAALSTQRDKFNPS